MKKALSAYEERLNNEKMPAGKRKVLIAALHLFANNGFRATTTAGIAKQAGVSEGTIYKYFSSKNELLNKMMTPMLVEIRSSFLTTLRPLGSLNKFVNFIVNDRIQFAFNNYELIKLFLQESLVSKELEPAFTNALKGQNGILGYIDKIKSWYSEINQNLTAVQCIRIFIAPMLAYVWQVKFLGLDGQQRDQELKIIKQQIIAGLTISN